MSNFVGTMLVALDRLERYMDKFSKMYGMRTVKHDSNCEISEACLQCRCLPDDMCECTCGKLDGYHG